MARLQKCKRELNDKLSSRVENLAGASVDMSYARRRVEALPSLAVITAARARDTVAHIVEYRASQVLEHEMESFNLGLWSSAKEGWRYA